MKRRKHSALGDQRIIRGGMLLMLFGVDPSPVERMVINGAIARELKRSLKARHSANRSYRSNRSYSEESGS